MILRYNISPKPPSRLLSILGSALLVILIAFEASSQVKRNYNYRPPMDIPLFLSGTFAELRSGHFHSGVDFRTQGVEGVKVFAIEDGHISRVVVSPVGLGKVVYIDHPKTGHTSVYAHLKRFHGELADYVLQQQYASESFAITRYPEAGHFRVSKGDLIGFSGNSGSSGGPHLHFEIRDAATQEPLNPLHFGFKVKDFIRPSITRLAVYPVGNGASVDGSSTYKVFEVQGWGEQHRIKDNAIIRAAGPIAFGISTHDTHNDTYHLNGVYSIELTVDSVMIFGFKADRFSFSETRYINSFIDYAHYQKQKIRLVRSEVDKMNRLGLYYGTKDRGIFLAQEGKTHEAEYVVTDNHGNISRLPFKIRGFSTHSSAQAEEHAPQGNTILAGINEQLRGASYYAHFSNDAFYRDQVLYHEAEFDQNSLSEVVQIGDQSIPVHSYYTIGIKPYPTTIPVNKLVIAYLEDGKAPSSIGGQWENGYIVARARALGHFAVMADTIPPVIRPLNFSNGATVSKLKQLHIQITDELSGIDTYRPSLNGKWILMDYDVKNKLLVYDFDSHLQKGMNVFEIHVYDKTGNQSVYRATLTY